MKKLIGLFFIFISCSCFSEAIISIGDSQKKVENLLKKEHINYNIISYNKLNNDVEYYDYVNGYFTKNRLSFMNNELVDKTVMKKFGPGTKVTSIKPILLSLYIIVLKDKEYRKWIISINNNHYRILVNNYTDKIDYIETV
jgi:hypothetical protein